MFWRVRTPGSVLRRAASDSAVVHPIPVARFAEPRLLQLHRLHDAVMLEDRAVAIDGFDMDEFINTGEAGFRLGEKDVRIELRFTDGAGRAVEETQLHSRQTVAQDGAGTIAVCATAPDTRVLRSWILGFGPHVAVIAPRALRNAVAEDPSAAAAMDRQSKRAKRAKHRPRTP